VENRVSRLAQYFDTYVRWYDATVPFVRAGQYELHRATIDRRYELGSVEAALMDDQFLSLLHRTLQAWGIGRRASRLVGLDAFGRTLRAAEDELTQLDGRSIEDTRLSADLVGSIGALVATLEVVENKSRVVAGTKTLHHLLPDLVPPMDRRWTGLFFRWSPQLVQGDARRAFAPAFQALHEVACQVRPSRLVGAGWRTSPAKVLDNAVIGFCKVERLGESPSR
jgi:hypothetical protein